MVAAETLGVAGGMDGTVQAQDQTPIRQFFTGVLLAVDGLVLRAASMANQSVGNAVGSAWLTVIGMICAAGVVAMVGFVIQSQVAIARLSEQQSVMHADMKDIKADIRELRGQFGQQGFGAAGGRR